MGQVFLHVLRFSPLTIIPPNFHIPSLIFHKSYTSVGIESVFREHDLIHVNQDRYFVTKFNDETSPRFPIHSGVPQGSILGPLLNTLYTSDFPTSRKTTLSTFADDTDIFATHSDATIAALNLQDHLHSIKKWLQKWKMKVNETKSTHIMFTLRKGQCPPVCINQTVIPQVETVKYLGLHFDRKLTWKEHIAIKRKQLDHKTRDIK